MFRNQTKRFWTILVVAVVVVVFYLPSLVAYRYTASTQNTGFLTHPWRSWSFVYTALTVPGDSQLKTSGQALRAAQGLFAGTRVHAHEVRVLLLSRDEPYTFTHTVMGREVTTTITPPYSFVWQASGVVDPAGHTTTVVALLDYRSGDVLYDIRTDLPVPVDVSPPVSSPSPAASSTP
jgi:hypothetical protein